MIPPLGLILPCTVLKAHDGDTLTSEIRIVANVRLIGCWAPELNQPGGPESQNHLVNAAVNRNGRLHIPIGENADNIAKLLTLGRVLGDVWIDGSQESVATMQVRTGHASSRKGGPLGE